MCDNQGPTLVLIKSTEGFIIGGYTPLNWDKSDEWKSDGDTFLFSLTNNNIYRKKKRNGIVSLERRSINLGINSISSIETFKEVAFVR